MDFEVDESLVPRLLFGALSEHEQRMLTARLARSDPEFRAWLRSVLQPFEMFDHDLVKRYSAALEEPKREIERRRLDLLSLAFDRAVDLEALIGDFTVRDALEVGETTSRFFTWSMAELLLRRSRESSKRAHHAKTDLYLASMVIDVVEILGASGHSPDLVNVVHDVRSRIRETAEMLASSATLSDKTH
ncbi:MAG: hypothetical protein GY719_01720 [bacterium]|nr:hypothetical protein [bacterium]